MTTVRLAYGGPGIYAGGDAKPTPHERMPKALEQALMAYPDSPLPPPALLVSYWYWRTFGQERSYYHFRDYSLDSGAFSAHHSGATIDLGEYIEFCRDRLTNDPQCTEVFALDVIGDWRASLKNTEAMWEAGVPAIPAYHVGEPAHVLKHMADTYPKIALGGAVGMRGPTKIAFAKAAFAQVWPKPIHGFGFGGQQQLMAVPWHSVDATNWETGPCRFGSWKSMPGGTHRGGNQPLRMEVEWYLRLEQRGRARWRREMKLLDDMLADSPHQFPKDQTVRLACANAGSGKGNRRYLNAFGTPPEQDGDPA